MLVSAHCADVVHNLPVITAVMQNLRCPKIRTHIENHGIRGECDCVIFLQP